MLTRLRKTQQENEGGFTLIELLVVVIIIGILAAIAIPTFLRQRERAWEKAVQSDLRNSAVSAEEFFNTSGSYVGFAATTAQGVKTSPQVTLTPGTMSASSYCINGAHANLSSGAVTFKLDSTTGSVSAGACP